MQEKAIQSRVLTSQDFEDDEEWSVKTGDSSFTLTGKQTSALKRVITAGGRGIVWFDDFAISIAHIVSIKRIKRGSKFIIQKSLDVAKKFKIDDTP